MRNITLKQLRNDFNYLEENLSDYAINEDNLVNNVARGLLNGDMDLKDYILWCIKDIISYSMYENEDDDDIEFLQNDKRVARILNRYNISLESLNS